MNNDEANPTRSGRRRRAVALVKELRPWVWPLGAWVIAYDLLRLSTDDLLHSKTDLHSDLSTEHALHEVMGWIARAQDSSDTGGIPAYYSLYGGWGPDYPETTGYLATTLLDYAVHAKNDEWRARAVRAGEWLLTMQDRSGWFPGGYGRTDDGPSVFNTGQILDGLISLSAAGESRFHEPAVRAADWLLSVQDADGAWRKHCYEGRPHIYYTMVAGALAGFSHLSGERKYLDVSLRNAEWVLAQQQADGWIEGYNLGGRPNFLHFIAYTLQGLLQVGESAKSEELLSGARRAAEALLAHFEAHKRLPGSFDAGWNSSANFVCLTGNAQVSIVWQHLYAITGEERFREAAVRLNEIVKAGIWQQGPGGLRGAVKGSDPVWGAYLPLRYPNWAAKFAADAFMLELRRRG